VRILRQRHSGDQWLTDIAVLMSEGELDEVRRRFEELTDSRDDRIREAIGHSWAHIHQGEFVTAVNIVEKWLDTTSGSDPYWSAMLHIRAEHAAMAMLAGRLHPSVALPIIRPEARSEVVDCSTPCDVAFALDLCEGRIPRALERARRRLWTTFRKRSKAAWCYTEIAVCLAYSGDLPGAREALRRATVLGPDFFWLPMARSCLETLTAAAGPQPPPER
jgi:hypothetical protein